MDGLQKGFTDLHSLRYCILLPPFYTPTNSNYVQITNAFDEKRMYNNCFSLHFTTTKVESLTFIFTVHLFVIIHHLSFNITFHILPFKVFMRSWFIEDITNIILWNILPQFICILTDNEYFTVLYSQKHWCAPF